jgi:hypothetical protein
LVMILVDSHREDAATIAATQAGLP